MDKQANNIMHLHRANFKSVIENQAFVLVDFWAEWCAPCMDFLPTYDAVAEQYPQIIFGKVNIDTSPEIAEYFNVKKVPSLLAIRDRIVLDAVEGLMKAHELAHHIHMWQQFDMQEINAHFDAKEANALQARQVQVKLNQGNNSNDAAV